LLKEAGVVTQKTDGIRRILTAPFVYNLFTKILGGARPRQELVEQYIKPMPGMRILDVGCGTGEIIEHLPEFIEYTGIDISKNYIIEANRKYNHRALFLNGDILSVKINSEIGYDIVLGLGLLHHLNDQQARLFFSKARSLLKPEGRCLTVDPGFVRNQNIIARSVIAWDRGQNVRYPEGYKNLAAAYFSRVDIEIRTDRLKIPYTHIIMMCRQ
jgi:2-polyprenyl-3-methyl-5-hydroxy-6-metoxy-1,4-benzoquinol methylase